jgi:hypothetical protein
MSVSSKQSAIDLSNTFNFGRKAKTESVKEHRLMVLSNGEFIMVYELDFYQGSIKYLKSMSLQGY